MCVLGEMTALCLHGGHGPRPCECCKADISSQPPSVASTTFFSRLIEIRTFSKVDSQAPWRVCRHCAGIGHDPSVRAKYASGTFILGGLSRYLGRFLLSSWRYIGGTHDRAKAKQMLEIAVPRNLGKRTRNAICEKASPMAVISPPTKGRLSENATMIAPRNNAVAIEISSLSTAVRSGFSR